MIDAPISTSLVQDRARAQRLLELYQGREGVYAKGFLNAEGRIGYAPVQEPLTAELVLDHIQGNKVLGVYLMRADSTVNFGVTDLDVTPEVLEKYPSPEHLPSLIVARRLVSQAISLGIPRDSMLINFSGRKGHHVDYFFAQPIPAEQAQLLQELILSTVELTGSVSTEIFPKQVKIEDPDDPHNLGNLVKLPLGIHPISNSRAVMIDRDERPAPVVPMPVALVEEILTQRRSALPAKARKPLPEEPIEEIREGERNRRLTSLAGTLRQQGYGYEIILNICSSLNLTFVPPCPDKEVVGVVRSVCRYPAGSGDTSLKPPPATQSSQIKSDDSGIDAASLVSLELPAARFAVEGVVPEGLSILAGRPKIGKSWLALDLGVAVAKGEQAMCSIDVIAGDVLYLALEDNRRRLQARLKQYLRGEAAPERLHLFTKWPRADQGGVGQIRKWCEEFPEARLVIIDTLARFRPAPDKKRSAYEDDYQALAGLVDLAGELHVAIIILHHDRKMASDDWVDALSGTLGLSGAADAILALFRTRGQKAATLKVTGRDVDEKELSLMWKDFNAHWELMGEGPEAIMSEQRRQIWDYLSTHSLRTIKEVESDLGKPYSTVYRTIKRMIEANLLVETGSGQNPRLYSVKSVKNVKNGGERKEPESSSGSLHSSLSIREEPVSGSEDEPTTPGLEWLVEAADRMAAAAGT